MLTGRRSTTSATPCGGPSSPSPPVVGEQYPVSPRGRGVAVVLMLVGIRLIGVLMTATVASYFVAGKAEQDKAELNERLDRIEALLTKALNRPDESDQLPPRQPTLRGRPGGA